MAEHVLVLIKPDGMVKNLMGPVLTRFFQLDLNLAAVKLLSVSLQKAEKHYCHLKGKPFYDQLINFITGKFHGQNKVLALVYSGKGAIRKCRELAGHTNPEEADYDTIRGAFGRVTTKGVFENVIHVSSDPKEAEREIKLWFDPDEILQDDPSAAQQ